jgi:hypothetical protein
MKLVHELVKNRFLVLTLILLVTNFVVFASIIWSKYPIYSYYDGWFIFVWEFKKFFLNPGFVMFSDISYTGFQLAGYWHAGCPLYPFIAAGVSIVAGNVIASMIITSAMISLLGVYFIRKIAKEFMNYDDAQCYQLICIFITFSFVSEFFFVPLPISITITIPIMDTYYLLRYFHSPSLKNKVMLASVFTLTLFTRELLFPMLLVPLCVLVLLKMKISLQQTRCDLQFGQNLVVLLYTTILIPCGIYAIYLLGTGTYASLILSLKNIWDCPKTVLWFFYSTFNTITFNWVFVLFCLIIFLRVVMQNFRKNNGLSQSVVVNSGNENFLRQNLVDFTNGTWFAFIFLSRILIPGCPIEAYFLPCAFSLAVYVFKGTRITSSPHLREYLFWIAIATNVAVLATQALAFYPFFDSNMYAFIDPWLRQEIGWPFYP